MYTRRCRHFCQPSFFLGRSLYFRATCTLCATGYQVGEAVVPDPVWSVDAYWAVFVAQCRGHTTHSGATSTERVDRTRNYTQSGTKIASRQLPLPRRPTVHCLDSGLGFR